LGGKDGFLLTRMENEREINWKMSLPLIIYPPSSYDWNIKQKN